MAAAVGDEANGRQRNDTPGVHAEPLPILPEKWVSWNDFVVGGFQIYNKFGKTLAQKLREPRNLFQAAIDEGFFSA